MIRVKKMIGWREYISIPELKIKEIKVKVDTGARTSALHVTDLIIHTKGKNSVAEFYVHPKQKSSLPKYKSKVKISGFKNVTSSNGETTRRPVIKAKVKLGSKTEIIEITLVNRDMMGFRMLLGRAAIKGDYIVDPGKSYLLKKDKK